MWAAPLLVLSVTLGAPAEIKNRSLAHGIAQYKEQDYAAALASLTQALDQPSSRRETAKIHLYIGLIQHHFKLREDADNSFSRALDSDPKVKFPKSAPKSALAMFHRLKKQKGIVDEPPRTRSQLGHRPRSGDDDDDSGAAAEADTEGDSSEGSSAAGANGLTSTTTGGPSAIAPPSAGADSGPRHPVAQPPLVERSPMGGDTSDHGVLPVARWVAVGVGGAAVVVGTTLGILAAKNGSQALSEPVASRAEDLHSTAVQQRTLAFVSFGIGAAALLGAGLMFFSSGSD